MVQRHIDGAASGMGIGASGSVVLDILTNRSGT